MEDHEYDGIQELDNPLPNWWLLTFLGTIIFAYLYYLHYESGSGPTINQELKADLAVIEAAKAKRGTKSDSEEELQKLLASAAVLNEGKAVFQGKCAACHGADLQGVIGPDLTDDYWLHGQGKLADIATIVRKGVVEKGMPPWDGQLKDAEVSAVTVYIVSKRGSHPANSKGPQGEKIVSN
ncbi:MAG: c-type cytochrome [Bdellovibrionales bacterium]|nr:c-type cytochrome [Bdellovibrionales bacterium]